jgi:hypothetical protein
VNGEQKDNGTVPRYASRASQALDPQESGFDFAGDFQGTHDFLPQMAHPPFFNLVERFK